MLLNNHTNLHCSDKPQHRKAHKLRQIFRLFRCHAPTNNLLFHDWLCLYRRSVRDAQSAFAKTEQNFCFRAPAKPVQIALEQRTAHTRQLFLEKQAELEKRRAAYMQQLKITQERLQIAEQTHNRRQVVEELLENFRKIGGLNELSFDIKRRFITQLVDEIIVNTKEHWFEIRGVLSDRFHYDDNDQFVSQSVNRLLT